MSKGSNVYFKLFMGDYLADTRHLTTLEHGAFLLMLMHYYRTQKPLPDNDNMLQRITGLTGKLWKQKKSILAQFFTIKNGFWYQKRADEEIAKAVETYQTKIENRKSKNSLNDISGIPQTQFKDATKNLQPTDKSGFDENARSTPVAQSTSTSVSTTSINTTTSITPSPTSYVKDADVKKVDFDYEKFKKVGEKVLSLCGNSPNLHFARVRTWLEADCDPELDIYPAIEMAMNKKHGIPPNSLSYFDNPVMQAKENRLKPLPTLTPRQFKQVERDDYLSKLKAEIAMEKSHAA